MSTSFIIAIVYGILQLVYGWVARKKHEAKVFLWLGIALGGAVLLGTIVFLLTNIGKNVALAKFDFLGWDVAGGAAGIATLVTGVMWLIKKKIWPNGIFFGLNLLFLLVWGATRFWYQGK
jgi:hypothetical protein